MNDNEMKKLICEKISYNVTNCFTFETCDNIYVGTDVCILDNQIKIFNVKVIDKCDYNNSYYYDYITVFIFEVESFNNCKKSYYDSFIVEKEIDYPDI